MRQLKIATQITNRDSQAVEKYLQEISKISMITPEEETTLAQRIKMGDQRALDKLVQANLRFVVSVAKQYQHQGLSLSDLINEGNLGLIKAAQRFDETKGFKFISYAVWWVRQSMIASLNENARTIRIPSNLVQDAQKEKKKHVSQEDRFYIDDESESTPIGTTLPYCIGLYREINEEGDQLIDVIPNKNIESPDAILNSPEEIKKKVNLMLSVLDDREKTIIERYFGLP